ncbi:hypothetical protein [Nocardia bovistercoris]|uniref:Uncharacterized protein n=1 Tax=Nocardia bovistercoris TaxID=2785916 RepID=A0A931I8Z5_9NOCA|nr:hypothetical protein [Nocardia bovistercoris]MBH0775563.1 hypothetical protein [Nocardia bovistercoris]
MTADRIGDVAVELLRIGHQVQGIPQYSCTDAQFLRGIHQPSSDSTALVFQVVDLRLDLSHGHRAVGGQVDQSGRLLVDGLRLTVQTGVPISRAGLLVAQGGIEQIPDGLDELTGELQRGVVLDNRLFDQCRTEMWQIAKTVLPCAARK